MVSAPPCMYENLIETVENGNGGGEGVKPANYVGWVQRAPMSTDSTEVPQPAMGSQMPTTGIIPWTLDLYHHGNFQLYTYLCRMKAIRH